MSEVQHESDTVLHQDAIEEIIDHRIDDQIQSKGAAIANLPAASATYVQAEATATRNALNSVLAALRAAGVIAP